MSKLSTSNFHVNKMAIAIHVFNKVHIFSSVILTKNIRIKIRFDSRLTMSLWQFITYLCFHKDIMLKVGSSAVLVITFLTININLYENMLQIRFCPYSNLNR